MSTRSRVLVVEHEPDDPPAWFGVWLEDAGCRLHVSQPWAGDVLPADLTGHDALLVMGGWMSAHHDAEIGWLTGVKDLVRQAARDGVPVLGICLGHQVAAVALGGEVSTNPRGKQIGLYDVGWRPAAADDPLMGPVVTPGRRGIHWNADVVTALPPGAVELARAPGGEVQAARFAPTIWGVQWHPEIDEPLLRRWVEEDPASVVALGLDPEAMLREVDEARGRLDAAWRPLAERFAAIVRRQR
ncbi:MAG TPA: type 1 glutamine amidotransferase [Nocardioides sp.]|uniref:type 1 glutamine amidotransferase n=1 Tax=Nocardioides sp. TaxID=35761 RepID=UPI002D07D3B9|nr:type 1 glutamine amidotransferase [Nocardioides sp.]HQR27013.1 type 1 glutamine amidotransferase [Nocardioides sp.]